MMGSERFCSACGKAIEGGEYFWEGKPYHPSCLPLEITRLPGKVSEELIREVEELKPVQDLVSERLGKAVLRIQEEVNRIMEGLGFRHYPYAWDLHPSYPFPHDWEKGAYGEDLALVFMYDKEGEGVNVLVRRSGELQFVPQKLSYRPPPVRSPRHVGSKRY